MVSTLNYASKLADTESDEPIDADPLINLEGSLRSYALHLGILGDTAQIITNDLNNTVESFHESWDPVFKEWDRQRPVLYASGHHFHGRLHLWKGNYTAALDEFDQALDIAPNYFLALVDKGFTLAKLGEHVQAREVLAIAEKFAITNESEFFNDESLFFTTARAYAILGDTDKALRYLKETIQHKPDSWERATAYTEFSTLKGTQEFDSLNTTQIAPS